MDSIERCWLQVLSSVEPLPLSRTGQILMKRTDSCVKCSRCKSRTSVICSQQKTLNQKWQNYKTEAEWPGLWTTSAPFIFPVLSINRTVKKVNKTNNWKVTLKELTSVHSKLLINKPYLHFLRTKLRLKKINKKNKDVNKKYDSVIHFAI